MSQKEKKPYVTYGSCGCGTCGASREITGCRFSLSPMSDQFIDIILGAVGKVHTEKFWKQTDKLSTVYRGKRIHVLDGLKACFVHAYRKGVHMTMEATVSKGCPGDTDAEAFLAEDDVRLNEPEIREIHFPVSCKFSMYPMGVSNYMEYIANVVNMAIDEGVYSHSAHYVSVLEGDVQDLFAFFDKATAYGNKNLSHYVLEITMSVNSPTAE
ncbi:MAG: YkoF family thiamine/hydroxymethylpyrimidine-binding protein [Candidatus Limivivens sp.]|nr:YkoF family thiamine/hydroxymethylpyrimidine-binding protein [Candidatus Limivivens sp.]